jgi:S1-C subfamily serine protease
LQPLLGPVEPTGIEITVWRAREKTKIRLSPGAHDAPPREPEGRPGLDLAPPDEGFRIGAVAPGSPAADAGIREGDALVRVNGAVPRTSAEAARSLSRRGRPVFVEVRSGPRRFGALLEPR